MWAERDDVRAKPVGRRSVVTGRFDLFAHHEKMIARFDMAFYLILAMTAAVALVVIVILGVLIFQVIAMGPQGVAAALGRTVKAFVEELR